MKDKKTSTAFWDRLGITFSGFCAIHCLFFPAVVALLPLWPAAGSIHQWTHPVLFILIVPTVIFAVRKCGGDGHILTLLYSGLIVVGSAWMLHQWLGSLGESLVTMAGSTLLVTGHWMNYKHHRRKGTNEKIKLYAGQRNRKTAG